MLLAPDVAPPPAIIRAHCPAGYAHVRCGFLPVPVDHQNPTGPTIRVYFERYLRRDRRDPAATTVVAIQGGPGFTTTGDRDSYRTLWRPVSRRRNLLLVDLRGTGRSGALACKAFANHVTNYNVRAGRCATQLGPRRRFYDTSQSVQDITSVLRAIRAGPVDLYGDSYGSYAAQAFAVRYPHRVRSLVLDSTYPVPGTDPAFADLALRSREAMRLACSRWPGCPVSHPVSQLRSLVRSVRVGPDRRQRPRRRRHPAAHRHRRGHAGNDHPGRLRQPRHPARPARGDRLVPRRRQPAAATAGGGERP